MRYALVIGLLSSIVAQTLVLPVSAQNAQQAPGGFYKYKQGELQKPVWSQYRPEIQIIRTDPIVKDFTADDSPGPAYVIPLPTHKQADGGGSVASTGSNAGSPGLIVLTPTGPGEGRILAPAGFESNMNALKAPRHALLPNGVTTGVHAKIDAPAPGLGTGGLLNKGPKSRPSVIAPPTAIAQYQASYPLAGAVGSSSIRTNTSVIGVLKRRGDLINQK